MEGPFSSLFNQFCWHHLHGKHHLVKPEIFVTESLYGREVIATLSGGCGSEF